MMLKIFSTVTLSILAFFAFGQVTLSGTVIETSSNKPVAYANIGLMEKGVGTVSNPKGQFELTITEDLLNNLLFVSHVGYEIVTLDIQELKNNSASLIIELVPLETTLQEVVVKASKPVSLGYQPNGNKVKGFFKASGLGLEAGTLIKNSEPTELLEFHLNILKIPFDSLKFRLNIYSVSKSEPLSRINTDDITFTVTKADTGHFSLPLTERNVQVTDDFICTIELIELFGRSPKNAEFLFSAIPNKKGLIYKKEISLAKWERIKKYSLCFWITGKN